MRFSILDQADEIRKQRMENYSMEIREKEEDTCPDCGEETEKGYQCSTCIKRYEEEIDKQARIEERYQYRQWRNDSGV